MPVYALVEIEEAPRRTVTITEEEYNLILVKRKEDEMRAKRDKYIAELNDLFQRMREDDFITYINGNRCYMLEADELEPCDSNGRDVVNAVNITK